MISRAPLQPTLEIGFYHLAEVNESISTTELQMACLYKYIQKQKKIESTLEDIFFYKKTLRFEADRGLMLPFHHIKEHINSYMQSALQPALKIDSQELATLRSKTRPQNNPFVEMDFKIFGKITIYKFHIEVIKGHMSCFLSTAPCTIL